MPAVAQQAAPQRSDGVVIQGTVHSAAGKLAGDATVRLQQKGASTAVETKTNAAGVFSFSALCTGSYVLVAEEPGLRSRVVTVVTSSEGEQEQVDLVLEESGTASADSSAGFSQAMEFADKPTFTVAGVTDWTAIGGHGSDSTLRTSEYLARETLTLKPEDASHSASGGSKGHTSGVSSRAAADEHRMAGEQDEKRGDPLAAVREFEQAARLDPSEQNYFEWGSELLLHRAVWQAQEVFQKGAEAFPKSARMLTALGTALFGGARYDEAALRLCDASDLNPAETEPYVFMGKIEMAAPNPLSCIEQRLARFAKLQPTNSLANYLYAMALLKRQEQSPDEQIMAQAEDLLTKAVAIDPKCAEAYLQLGILSFSRRNFDNAIGFYAKAVEANPELDEAHYRLGVAYDRIGLPEKAKVEFQLHDEIKKRQAEEVERRRREVKQFLVVAPGKPGYPPAQ
ncbi:MAG: carboxypeptidase regulatory-like domain-containing protein [Terracidiphilus sp.]|jgi:tetratricopeptide (TPR) repeat protein